MKKYSFVVIPYLILCILTYVYFGRVHYEDKINISDLKKCQYIPWGVKSIIKDDLRSKFTGKGIKIAILDSGIKFNHPDFGLNIKHGYNVINPKELPIDDNGHGTLVAGVIGAQNNSIGIVGIAPYAEIYPVKVLDKYGEGDINDIAKGIDWCIENKIQIINMSFGILKDKPVLYNSVKKAIDSGILVVASTYNSYGQEVGYPASYDKVISVTAVDSKYRIGETSPRGKVDFSAPGTNILSTTVNNGYEYCSGTSFATPYISAVIALILENPKIFMLSGQENYAYEYIYNALKRMSKHLGGIGKNSTFGEGFVSVNNII
ncbi:S8 family peptidase [Clostridium rectalis]|uniref:S8 family peptidase n=1 Tax=Clostridium rectalis TaxID=2040295 RepID=UPI000F642A73|nr:S8 family peptidase [Clostridium rectalis]